MFRATLSDVDLLKNSVPIIAEIVDEGIFNVDQNGISLLTPDRTMVSVVDFKILSSAFDDFKAEGTESLGLRLGELAAVLKRVKGASKLTLESTKNRLKLKIEGNGARTFEIPLIDVKTEKPPVEQLKFPATIEVDSSIIEEGIADAELIGDSVVVEANPNLFRMLAKGDISSAQLELKQGETGLTGLVVKEAVKSQYPLDYLKKMIKAARLSGKLRLEFGTDYPMRLSFKETGKISLSFVLAPRVQE
ncbi:MAG: proliferating cell nuclear antigen (pcna) [Candidatus Aenigmatarchaeota archaeon]